MAVAPSNERAAARSGALTVFQRERRTLLAHRNCSKQPCTVTLSVNLTGSRKGRVMGLLRFGCGAIAALSVLPGLIVTGFADSPHDRSITLAEQGSFFV